MKKFLSLLLAAIMLLGCLPAMAEAGTFTANADKHMITAYKGEDENLVVPASVDGVPTPIINWQTINGAKKAVTLTLEEGITQIRSNNIASLNITQLTLPSTLEVIANNNIYQTDKLTEVTVPAAVSYVGTLTFSYCDVLTKVTFTGLCPVFGPRTFVSTAKDLVVYVPDDQLDAYKAALPEGLNIQSSGKNAVDARVRVSESDFEFDAATGTIKKYNGTASYIEIPATIGGVQVKTIGQKAFYQHPYMTVVIIPEGVETLEMYSIFAGSGLYRVELPSTLKTIGNNALWGAELDSVKLPEGLEKIGDGAFTNGMYSKVEELIIPDSVTSIGKEAFKGCTPIKIIIGANVQSLAEGAFGALNYVEEVVIRNTNGMTIDPKAFQSSKKGATITLMDGITEEVYNSYVEQLAVAYENATVNQPELAAAFPTLDAEAGAPFIGNWSAVAGKDVMGEFTDEYPVVTATLNPDGTAGVNLDGVEMPSAWYVDAGYAFLAPVENGKADAASTYAMANIDENGRLVIDLFYAAAICEQEGKVYAAPARPEKPWPEFNMEDGKYYVGTWEAVSYIVEGETVDASLIGPMTLTLNDDGTALSSEGGEETYALRWYADYPSAFVGETVNTAFEINFDGNGNIKMNIEGTVVVLAPKVESVVEITVQPKDAYAPEGEKAVVTFEAEGEGLTYAWYYRNFGADEFAYTKTFTSNTYSVAMNADRDFREIYCVVTDKYGNTAQTDTVMIFMEAEEYTMPEAAPIGSEGEPYFGAWKGDMFGMEVILILNQDGTCAMEMMGESEPGVWTMENGKAYLMGDEITIDGDGNLVYESAGMILTKTEDGASSEEMSEEEMLLALLEMMSQMEGEDNGDVSTAADEDFYIGRKFVMTGAVINGINLSADQLNAAGDYVIFNADGSVELFMGDRLVETLGWTRGTMNIAGQEYEGFIVDYYGTIYNFGIAPYGLAFDYFGTVRMYEPEGGMPSEQPQVTAEPETFAEPEVPAAMFNSYEDYMDIKFVAKTYTSFGTVQDASTLGAEYAVTFHANGTCEFVMAGINTPGLTWGLQEVAMGLTKAEAFVINYYGVNYNCIPTGTGFDMDFYGTMNLHFVPAE